MKNKELIALLSELPPEDEVLAHGEDLDGSDVVFEITRVRGEPTCNEGETVVRITLEACE